MNATYPRIRHVEFMWRFSCKPFACSQFSGGRVLLPSRKTQLPAYAFRSQDRLGWNLAPGTGPFQPATDGWPHFRPTTIDFFTAQSHSQFLTCTRIGVPTGSRLAFPAFPAKFCSLPGGHSEAFRTLLVTAPDAVPALGSCDTSSMPPDSGTYNRQCGHDLRNVVAVRGFFTGSSCSDNFPENHQSRDSGQHRA